MWSKNICLTFFDANIALKVMLALCQNFVAVRRCGHLNPHAVYDSLDFTAPLWMEIQPRVLANKYWLAGWTSPDFLTDIRCLIGRGPALSFFPVGKQPEIQYMRYLNILPSLHDKVTNITIILLLGVSHQNLKLLSINRFKLF